MKIFINKVGKSTYDRATGKIYNFWFEASLKSGKTVHIFDKEPFDLRDFEKQAIECLIFAGVNKNPVDKDTKEDFAHPIFKGDYLGEYEIPKKWKLGVIHQDYMDLFPKYHAIQLIDGIILISPKMVDYFSLKKGDVFIFKATKLVLLSYGAIEGEAKNDSLVYEKNFLEEFWNLIDSTREKCNKDIVVQVNLIEQELLNWSYDDIMLFSYLINHMQTELNFNENLENHFIEKCDDWNNFLFGLITLGKRAFMDIIFNFTKFKHDIETGIYTESIDKIEYPIYYITSRVIEEKSGELMDEVFDKYVRKDIEEIREKIFTLFDISIEKEDIEEKDT